MGYLTDMDDYLPQDEYFEWEDLEVYKEPVGLTEEALTTHSTITDLQTPFPSSIRDRGMENKAHWSQKTFNSVISKTSQYSIRTSLSLDFLYGPEAGETPIDFPSYENVSEVAPNVVSGSEETEQTSPMDEESRDFEYNDALEMTGSTKDDTAFEVHPVRHVDYLSHDWAEEDIWTSRRHLRAGETLQKNVERLENACWRAWAKTRNNLKTISPETFNWMKDQDDTWLYGPFFHHPTNNSMFSDIHSCSHVNKKHKTILKKQTVSQILLRGSVVSPHPINLVSSTEKVAKVSKKSVRFHDEVEEFMVVDSMSAEDTEDEVEWTGSYQSTFEYGGLVESSRIENSSSDNVDALALEAKMSTMDNLLGEFSSVTLGTPNKSSSTPNTTGARSMYSWRPTFCPSNLSEWTMLGGCEEDEDLEWHSPAPHITRSNATVRASLSPEELAEEAAISPISYDEFEMDPLISDNSETQSSGSSDMEEDDSALTSAFEFSDEDGDVEFENIQTIPTLHQMKQALVDQMMEEYYTSSKEDEMFAVEKMSLRNGILP